MCIYVYIHISRIDMWHSGRKSRVLHADDFTRFCMRNLLGWQETRLAQITLTYIKIAYVVLFVKVV